MIPILVYTHSEYSFLWKATIPLLERYAKGFQIIWCCDSLLDYKLPPTWILYTYDTSLSWGYRVKRCLEAYDFDYLIYIQEDWLLIDSIQPERVEHCLDFMKQFKCEFLMTYPWNNTADFVRSNYESYIFVKQFSHYFQPGIWKKSLLYDVCSLNVSIQEYESDKCFNLTKDRNCYGVYCKISDKDLSTRGFFFPHMHAIVQGKWTFVKYPCLKALVESYGIDTSKREIDTSWTPTFQ